MGDSFEVLSQNALELLNKHVAWDLVSSAEWTDQDPGSVGVARIIRDNCRFWTAATDTSLTRLAVIRKVPIWDHLTTRQRRLVLRRCWLFFGHSEVFPLRLPHTWQFYAEGRRVAFFAANRGDIASCPRWVVQYQPSDILYFSDLYKGQNGGTRKISEFSIDETILVAIRSIKSGVIADSKHQFNTQGSEFPRDIELDRVSETYHIRRTYEKWLAPNMLTAGQKAFVVSGCHEPAWLKGPAGSGKTLALELKAIHDAREAARLGADWRALYITHNWALCEQVQADLYVLEPNDEIRRCLTVAPLMAIAQEIRQVPEGITFLGTDSQEAYQFQEMVLQDALMPFMKDAFTAFKFDCTPRLRGNLETALEASRRAQQFRRDLITEFAVVMGGENIQRRPRDLERYLSLNRRPQWLDLKSEIDRRAVYDIYQRYLAILQGSDFLTVDQYLSTSLKWLDSFEWGIQRRSKGADAIYVDELHLFNQQERTFVSYLTREARDQLPIFMALDPAQSPTGRYGTLSNTESDLIGEGGVFELQEIYRYTPQILKLIKHLSGRIPTHDLGRFWSVNIEPAQSRLPDGVPLRITDCRRAARTLQEIALEVATRKLNNEPRVALAIIDADRVETFITEAESQTNRHNLAVLRTRDDLGLLAESQHRLVVGLVDYLAGLQFDSVVITGLDDSRMLEDRPERLNNFISRLYLAASRARKDLEFVVNTDEDGLPEVLKAAITQRFLQEDVY
jgi:hypothetical protein